MTTDFSERQRDLLVLCALKAGGTRCDWGVIARHAYRFRGLEHLKAGDLTETSTHADRTRWTVLTAHESDWKAAYARADSELAAAATVKASLTTVLDDDYPLNLRDVHNRPPFLFYRGSLHAENDARNFAVAGTRRASVKGLNQARRLAKKLVEHGVTVTSGLALGIDTAAHRGALEAHGRTIAVSPAGITGVSPKANRDLLEEIIDSGGLVVSQFFPAAGVARWHFGQRNVAMSGISQGTVVIEAGHKSGTRMLTNFAYKQGKQVFLFRPLVKRAEWASAMIKDRKAVPVDDIGCLLRQITTPERPREAREAMRINPTLI